ncbi:MAG: hypothetical protein KJ905_03165 [Nanoarchaeota archaeon]|nr:hypothetical protein [Nanoarchaeota archaeon]MBU1501748.1 hypothetical protein [Nanoarchaeota archaeon]MBU2458795.1 hypothetical protein [Nanoarchaeota archaeon]
MAESISEIIGRINPEEYADNSKELLKEYGSADKIPSGKVKPKDLAEHKLIYDSSSETLEPIYFFILDLMNDFGFQTEKLIDNFTSSPGSGHFAELGQRATIMQQQGSKLLGDINTVLRSVLNLIYDLKDFKLRLQSYDELRGGSKEAAILSLKQIWMDKVDITKQNSSIKAMALGQAGFQTLVDAFLVVKDENLKDGGGNEIDLNDRVKRILRGRILEFNHWLVESEKELRKRYELEKNYLRSQVNALKLYSRWAKPYLKAAQELEMGQRGREPALVKAFNTIILELTLIGKRKIDVKGESRGGNLPKDFEKLKTKDYSSCVLVSFKFRGIPQRASQQQSHYVFGGRAEVSFKAYALNEDEIKKIDEELEASDIGDALRLIEGTTTESLDQLQDEINYFLEEKDEAEEEKKKSGDSSNPFKALLGGYNESEDKGKDKEKKGVKEEKEKVILRPESWAEKEYIRPFVGNDAKEKAFLLFDIYKKAHGMASFT